MYLAESVNRMPVRVPRLVLPCEAG